MVNLKEIVHQTIRHYARNGVNFESFLTVAQEGDFLTVVDIARDSEGKRFAATSIIVHIMRDMVVIEHDDNEVPLADALLQAGIPRQQIVLAYAGEPVPTTA